MNKNTATPKRDWPDLLSTARQDNRDYYQSEITFHAYVAQRNSSNYTSPRTVKATVKDPHSFFDRTDEEIYFQGM